MSTTVTFAGNLTGDPELLHTRDGNPFVACQVLVNRCFQEEAGEWLDGESTGQDVTIGGIAANHLYVSAGRGNRVAMDGQLRSEAWRDGESDARRIKPVVIADNRSGEVGPSLTYDAARLERRSAPTGTTEN
jgi:single-stranded DNA-binding protein